MSPIYVNVPQAGALDTAGRGVAAAQQYRQGEQKMKALDFEMDLATRKVEFEEQALDFEREQLAASQEAEADILLGQAIESGVDVGDQGAYREALKRASPRFRSEMAREFGRAARLKAQEAEMAEIAGEIENTPETMAKVQSGALTEPAAIKRSMAAERTKIARTGDQEAARVLALETWQKRQAEPNFDMPDEGVDPEAYGDVMEILGELAEGAATNPKTNYRALNDQLTLLTTKGMRAAAMAILQRDIGGVDPRGLPRSSRMDAMQQQDFPQRAAGEYVDQRGDAAQSARNADVKGGKTKHGPAVPPGAAQPAAGPKPKSAAEIGAKDVIPAVEPEKAKIAQQALKNLGMKKVPEDGTPEFQKFVKEVLRLQKEPAATAENDIAHRMMQELR